MRFTHIRNFVAAVEAGSLRAAARSLNVAQPELTRNVRELEEELGVRLLERSPRGVAPTDAGKSFLSRARSIQNELSRIKEEAAQLGAATARLCFGAGIFSDALLPGAMAAFRSAYPNAEVRIAGGFGPPLLSQLREGLIEFAVTALAPGSHDYQGMKVTPLFANWRVIVGRGGHPLRQAKTLDRLLTAEWLIQTLPEMMSEPTPPWFADLFEKNGLQPPRSITRCDGHMFSRLLLSSDMIGVASPYSLLFELGVIEIFAANSHRPPSAMFSECLVCRADTQLSPAAHAMVKAIKSEARKLALAANPHA